MTMTLKKVKSESLGNNLPAVVSRTPWYCAGCPHNSGTKTPDDEVVGIGIGCHSIGYFLHPEKLTNFSQMGGEGGHWIDVLLFQTKNILFKILVMALMLTPVLLQLEQLFLQMLILPLKYFITMRWQ